MKNTLMYLKVLVFIMLIVLFLAGCFGGGGLVVAGVVNAIFDRSIVPLVLIPVGLFCCLIGFVALDALAYINDNWSWQV
jgi:hypothetical protein